MTAKDRPAGTETPPQRTWRLDTDNGSMAPRSALDVLVDLNDNLASGDSASTSRSPWGSACSTRQLEGGFALASYC